MKTINYSASYQVGSGPVRLVIRIGDAQFGSSLVIVGATLFPQARTFDQILGGAELVGKTISAVSVVTDTNAQTNHTSVTYELSGGPSGVMTQESEFTVEVANDSVQYVAQIALIK